MPGGTHRPSLNSTGHYTIGGLKSGQYVVRVVARTGYKQTAPITAGKTIVAAGQGRHRSFFLRSSQRVPLAENPLPLASSWPRTSISAYKARATTIPAISIAAAYTVPPKASASAPSRPPTAADTSSGGRCLANPSTIPSPLPLQAHTPSTSAWPARPKAEPSI